MELTVRTLDRHVRDQVEKRIRAITAAQAESFGVTAHVDYQRAFAVLVNTPDETAFARELGREMMGDAGIDPHFVAQTASEDFSYMLEQRPGSYLYIGNGVGQEHGSCQVHNPGYDFNDANLPIGSAYFALLAERYLAGSVSTASAASAGAAPVLA
jgi:hippurate hydrolase